MVLMPITVPFLDLMPAAWKGVKRSESRSLPTPTSCLVSNVVNAYVLVTAPTQGFALSTYIRSGSITPDNAKSYTKGTCSAPSVICDAGSGNMWYGSAWTCASCEEGKYTDGFFCVSSCSAGRYSAEGANLCLACEAGKSTSPGSTFCNICGAHYFSTGGSICTRCPVGKHISDPVGSYGAGTSTSLHDSEDDCKHGHAAWYATNFADFFNLVSNNIVGENMGNATMSRGDEVIVSVGSWACGPCAFSYLMLVLNNLYGIIRCEHDNLGCIIDAESSRRIISISGSLSQTLTLRSLDFFRGRSTQGGAIFVQLAIVDLELCAFSQCTASIAGGAIYVNSETVQVNIFATAFISNSAVGSGDDIYKSSSAGAVTVHDTCPNGFGGAPSEGENTK